MVETDYAWAAGIFDGEGCIHIRKNKVTETSRHRTTHYALVLKVTMTHRPTVERLRDVFDVGYVARSASEKPRKNEGTTWYCMSGDAAKVLALMGPYLVTKAEEADVALEFLRLPSARKGKAKVSPELLALREEFYLRLRSLKGRAKYYDHGGKGSGILATAELEPAT